MKRDIYSIITELRDIPNKLHYYIGATAYESLLMELEPLIGNLEDELDSMIPEWTASAKGLPGDCEEIIVVWMDPDGFFDSIEWFMSTEDELRYTNLNSANLNTFTRENLFTHWRPVNQLDYPMET